MRIVKINIYRFLYILPCIFFISLAIPLYAKDASLKIGITSSLNKVFQDPPYDFQGTYTNTAEIELARNEYEATQLVLFPTRDLQKIWISASNLKQIQGKHEIPATNIDINIIGYINLIWPEIGKNRSGFYPDPLLPNQTISLSKDKPQAYLVTIHAPTTTPSGDYEGTLIISDSSGQLSTVKLKVHVWDITLPKISEFKTLSMPQWSYTWSMWPEDKGYSWPSWDERKQRFIKLADLAFKNRLPPTATLVSGLNSHNWKDQGWTSIDYPTHDGEERGPKTFNPQRTDELINYIMKKGANSFFIAITSDIYAIPSNAKQREETLLKYLHDVIPHLRKRGLMNKVYVYNVDEPWGKAVDHAKSIYKLIKKEFGNDVFIMQNMNQDNDTIIGEFQNNFDAIDINLGFYNINKTDTYRKNNPAAFKDFWWNINIWPRTHPNLFVEYPLVDARILGPMSFKYNVQGFEYWDLLSMEGIINYSPIKPGELKLNWRINKGSLDGLLVYPSADMNFYSSLRFESFRDGMEDQDLLYILKKLDPHNSLLQIPIINNIDDYTQNSVEYLDFRRKVASAIETLKKAKPRK